MTSPVTYSAHERDPRYVWGPTESNGALIAGATIERDADGIPVLTAAQVDAVRAVTLAITAEYEARTALPVDPSALVRGVVDTLRDVDVTSAAPDRYDGVRSSTMARRTRKGRTTVRVLRHGRQHRPVTDEPSGIDGAAHARDAIGAPTGEIALTAFADALLRAHEHETTTSPTTGRTFEAGTYRVLGGVLFGKEEMTPRISPHRALYERQTDGKHVTAWNGAPVPAEETYGVHTDACGVARQANDMRGWFTIPDDYVTGDAENRPHRSGDTALRWAVRTRIVRTRRKGESDAVHVFPDADASAPWITRAALVADHTDPRFYWLGHERMVRPVPERERRTASTREARAEITARRTAEINAVPADLVDAIDAALRTGGEQCDVATPRGTLTLVARGNTGRVTCTLVKPDGTGTLKWQARGNAGRIAIRVMS